MSTKIKQLYNNRAQHYELDMAIAGYHRLLNYALKRISQKTEIKPKPKIVDVGCGTGLSTQIALKYIPDAQIFGMDLSEKMLDKYVKVNNKAFIGDFNNPTTVKPFSSKLKQLKSYGPFDFAISAASVSEYGNQNAVQYMHDLLKKEGKLIMVGMKKNQLSRFTGKFWGYKPAGLKKMQEYCYNAGFSKVFVVPISWQFPLLRQHKFIIVAVK